MRSLALYAIAAVTAIVTWESLNLLALKANADAFLEEKRLADGTRCVVTDEGVDCDWEGICDGHGVVP